MPSFRNPASRTAKADAPVVDQLDDPKVDAMERVYAKPLVFQVVHTRVMVRKSPSTKGELIRSLPKGSEVSGYLQGTWLHVPGERPGWILTDGTNLGFGLLLEHKYLRMDVKYCFSNAVLVQWPKLPGRVVEYSIEWHSRDEPEKVTTSNQRETNNVARVQGLPHETEIKMRVTARILTDVREYGGDVFASLTGEWCEAETDREITDLEEENLCCDPLANIRGRCMDCDCDGFVMSNYGGNRPEQRMESIACRRCACSCTRHLIIGEFSYRGSGKRSAPPAQPAPKLIDKQIGIGEVRKQAAESIVEITWTPEDARQGDKVQFVLDKVAQARTLYETLGVSSGADDKDVRSAYRQASLIIHPDKVRGRGEADLAEQAEAAFKIITSAYEILGDEMKRVMYDRSLNKHRPASTIGGSRSNLNGLSFIRRFLSKAGFGYDLNARPKGDWEQTGPGQWRRSTKANIVVTHAISGDTYEVACEKGTSVNALKKRLVRELKRGPESRIELAGVDGSDRPNTYVLGSSETLILVGIDLGDPKDVKVCLCHADTGARVRITVLDTSVMEEVRQAAALKLNCDVQQVQLGFRANNTAGFQAFEDTEYLNSREQILIKGVDVVPMFTVEEALELQNELLVAYGADWVQKQIDDILEEFPPLEGMLDPEFRERWSDLIQEAQRDTLVKHGFDGPQGVYSMLHAFSEVGGHPDVRQKVQEIDKKLRVTTGAGLPPVIKVTIEQAAELDLSIVVDRLLADWPMRLKVRQGLTVRALKESLAAGESLEGISADDFGLCTFVPEQDGPVKQLQDLVQLTASHTSLAICDKTEPVLTPLPAKQSDARTVPVAVYSWSKIGDVREALAKKIGADVKKLKLVSESDTAFVEYRDTDEVGTRKRFKVLGAELPELVDPPKPKPARKSGSQNRQEGTAVVKEEPLIQEVHPQGQEEPKQRANPEPPKKGSSDSKLPTPSSAPVSASPVAPGKTETRGDVVEERRKAEDGKLYTREEFMEFYGTMEGGRQWIMAEKKTQPKAQKIEEKPKDEKETQSTNGVKPQATEADVQPLTPKTKQPDKTEEKQTAPKVEEKEAPPPKPVEVPQATVSEKPAPKPVARETPVSPDVSPPKKPAIPDKPVFVDFSVKHVSSGASVTLKIMSNSTMLMVKRAIATRIGRPEVLEFGKLVKEVDGSYESISDGEVLGLREELIFMNASLEENPNRHEIDEQEYKDAELRKNGQVPAKPKEKPASNDVMVKVTAIQSGITVAVKIDKVTTTAAQLKEILAKDTGRPEVMEGKVLRRNNDNSGYSSFKDEDLIEGRTQLHFMGANITPLKGSAADKRIRAEMKARTNPKARAKAQAALPEPEEPVGAPELVLVTISHATNTKDKPVEVVVMNDLTVASVKEALAKKLKRPELMTKGRFVQKKGMSSFSAVRDSELIGNRKSLLFMGMDLK